MKKTEKNMKDLLVDLEAMRTKISLLENEHKRADELVLQSIYSWEETFNNITDMITIHDRDYNIIHANKAAEELLGLPLLENKGSKCYRFYHGTESAPEGCPSLTIKSSLWA